MLQTAQGGCTWSVGARSAFAASQEAPPSGNVHIETRERSVPMITCRAFAATERPTAPGGRRAPTSFVAPRHTPSDISQCVTVPAADTETASRVALPVDIGGSTAIPVICFPSLGCGISFATSRKSVLMPSAPSEQAVITTGSAPGCGRGVLWLRGGMEVAGVEWGLGVKEARPGAASARDRAAIPRKSAAGEASGGADRGDVRGLAGGADAAVVGGEEPREFTDIVGGTEFAFVGTAVVSGVFEVLSSEGSATGTALSPPGMSEPYAAARTSWGACGAPPASRRSSSWS
jgi:hypothetical protein